MVRVLHLTGSTVDAFHTSLSRTYQEAVVRPPGFLHSRLHHEPDGSWWHFGDGDMGEALDWNGVAAIAGEHDVLVPHMFCPTGMTTMRALFEDVLGLPVAGPAAVSTTLALGKWTAQAIAEAAGVACPQAVRVDHVSADLPFAPPFIVKPDAADNSKGLTLVRRRDQARAALERALAQGGTAIVQRYIAGREFRVGVLEWDGELRVLPALEYLVSAERPIRTLNDKLDVRADDSVGTGRWEKPTIPSVCPARIDDGLRARLAEAVRLLHPAFHGRDYGLFDFRVDASGKPWLLEPCTFWSFSTRSVLSFMVNADPELELADVAAAIWRRAAARGRSLEPQPQPQVSRAALAAEVVQRMREEQNSRSTFE